MRDREERRERRERWLQTAAFLGAVAVFGSVLYAAWVVQQNRREETLPTPSPTTPVATPYTPVAPIPTPAGTSYPWIHVIHIPTTPGTTPYPAFVFVGPYYPYMAAPDVTSLPGAVVRPELLTPVAGYGAPPLYPTGWPALVPRGAAVPSSSPTPLPEGPTP